MKILKNLLIAAIATVFFLISQISCTSAKKPVANPTPALQSSIASATESNTDTLKWLKKTKANLGDTTEHIRVYVENAFVSAVKTDGFLSQSAKQAEQVNKAFEQNAKIVVAQNKRISDLEDSFFSPKQKRLFGVFTLLIVIATVFAIVAGAGTGSISGVSSFFAHALTAVVSFGASLPLTIYHLIKKWRSNSIDRTT